MPFREKALWFIIICLMCAVMYLIWRSPGCDRAKQETKSSHYQLNVREDGFILFDSTTPAIWVMPATTPGKWNRISLPFEIERLSTVPKQPLLPKP